MCKRTLLLVENGGKRLVVWKRKRWKREGDDDGKRGWWTQGNPETGWCIRWGRNAWPEARVCEALRTSTRRPTGSAIHTALSLSSAFPSWFAVLLFGNADTFLNKQYSPGKKVRLQPVFEKMIAPPTTSPDRACPFRFDSFHNGSTLLPAALIVPLSIDNGRTVDANNRMYVF